MKKAKVSSVYEGRGRKGENSSKSARMAAKGRRDGVRAKKALSINPRSRTMVTRSMKVKTMEEMQINEENLHEVEIIQAKVDENGYIKPIEVPVQPQEVVQQQEEVQQQEVQQQEVVQPQEGEQPPVTSVAAVAENAGDDGEIFTWEEWTMSVISSDYEKEWPWFRVAYEGGWYSYWEALTGEFWTQPFMDDRDQPIWSDLWDFDYDY